MGMNLNLSGSSFRARICLPDFILIHMGLGIMIHLYSLQVIVTTIVISVHNDVYVLILLTLSLKLRSGY